MTLEKEAQRYRNNSIQFMRDLIRIPGISANEAAVAQRICQEMQTLNYDRVWTDQYGNVIGQIGNGPIRLVLDSHIDTVDIGNRSNWDYDPFEGKLEAGYIYGRGASDNHNGTVPQVYGAKLFKDLGGDLNAISVFVVGTVQEEDCDGLALRYLLENSVQNVHFICLGEATNLKIYRGHRGRMEIKISTQGQSCHGSAPERGDNAIYRMVKLVSDIEKLNEHLAHDHFLGKGTCAVTHISCDTPSLCAVPDGCHIHIDRRLTHGEDKNLAVQQIRELPNFDPKKMQIEILTYDTPSYKGSVLKTEKYYPTWVLPEKHELVQAGIRAANIALGHSPEVSKWVFSTNGVASMGQLGIPTIGFGPAMEEDAHSTHDRIKIDDMIKAIAFYAALPIEILKIC